MHTSEIALSLVIGREKEKGRKGLLIKKQVGRSGNLFFSNGV